MKTIIVVFALALLGNDVASLASNRKPRAIYPKATRIKKLPTKKLKWQ